MTLTWGDVPVPWTVSWSAEERFFLAMCRWAQREAICQPSSPGNGKPNFGKPHWCRQRRAITECRCDLCGKPIKLETKVSLSHARPVAHGAQGMAILQVEPMLHRTCAALCTKYCPSLKRDVADGSLRIRQVTRWRPQFALMDAEYVETITGTARIAVGYAKVELLQWTDRDQDWLEAA